jgi:pimeloyl-ACP methyl ester carboxylesterase
MAWSDPERRPLPLILIRGFGGLNVEDEKQVAYQGFNDGTVYPQKRGENYIYEGLILRFMKSNWRYYDATNVVNYYSRAIEIAPATLPDALSPLSPGYFKGKVVIDAGTAAELLGRDDDPHRTLWVFRYYDLGDRQLSLYAQALVRLIDFIRDLAAIKHGLRTKVNVLAHSMGGLIVRHAVQVTFPKAGGSADASINKIVTLGTPHRGISFQVLSDWAAFGAADELNAFNPENQANDEKPASFENFSKHFPPERVLTVVGTNYRTYSVGSASLANRLFSWAGEFGSSYNRSDGLVKQTAAQLRGAPRTFVHKCHGGFDSLVTARESFEVATRFLFGDIRARLRLLKAKVLRAHDLFGTSEFYLGVSVKPRGVDFDLFHQSAEAENCYGPFRTDDLTDLNPTFNWTNDDGTRRVIWEGWLNTKVKRKDQADLVFRLDFYIGERDLLGFGFSDNVVFRKQYYLRAVMPVDDPKSQVQLYCYDNERFTDPVPPLQRVDGGWSFAVRGTGFEGAFAVELDSVPEIGPPRAIGSV